MWLSAIVVIAGAEIWWSLGAHHYFDLKVYEGALRSWLRGHDLYGYAMPPPANEYGFTYPPFAAVVLTPLALLPIPVAAGVSVAASVLAMAVVIDLLTRRIPSVAGFPRYRVVGIGLCVVLALYPTRLTLAEGQINVYLLLLVTVDVLCLAGGRYGGVCVGLAAAIKITPAAFILYFLIRGQVRPAIRAVTVFAACGLIGIAAAPSASVAYWTRILWQPGRVGRLDSPENESVRGVLARSVNASTGMILWVVAVGVLAVVWWRAVRIAARHNDDLAGLGATGAFACLAAPITWVHHMVFLIPALACLFRRSRRGAYAAIGLCAVLAVQVDELAHGRGTVAEFFIGGAFAWVALALLIACGWRVTGSAASTVYGPSAGGRDRVAAASRASSGRANDT